MRVAMAACMTKLLRALPALVAVLALASTAHAEDSVSPSSTNESAEKSDGLELTLGLGAGDISTGAPDWSTHRGVCPPASRRCSSPRAATASVSAAP
ncbi:MAG: hypothetical protein ACXVEF_14955 [Polyangiales bacterium]